MKTKHYEKGSKRYFGKLAITLIAVAVIGVSSFATVMANTIPCTVVDGEGSYSFSLLSPAQDDIIKKAVEEGMPPLGKNDKVAMDGEKGKIVVKRALDVSIHIDNEYLSAIVFAGDTVADALTTANVSTSANDAIEPAQDVVINEATTVKIRRYTAANVTADGKTNKAELFGGTVQDALNELKIKLSKDDICTPAVGTSLTDGMKIDVTRVNNIKIIDADKEKAYKIKSLNVKDALKELGVKVSKEDKISVALTEKIKAGLKIEIDRISYKDTTETAPVPYETVYKDDSSMLVGETETETAGLEGEKEIVYRQQLVNGEKAERKVLSETVTAEPINEVILNGTKEPEPEITKEPEATEEPEMAPEPKPEPTGSTFVDNDGNTVSYSSVMSGECTAYSDPGGITSLGEACQVGVVAVNPAVIPYGTKMYVTSGDIVYGYCVAGDTGGAALAGDILVDVYYDSSGECTSFGRRDMTVYILS